MIHENRAFQQPLPLNTASNGDELSATPPSNGDTDYTLVISDKDAQKTNNDDVTGARVDLSESPSAHLPPPLGNDGTAVEGFLLSRHPCSPRHHLYPRFVDFPTWNYAWNSDKPHALASMEDETWDTFRREFQNDLDAGYRNLCQFRAISLLIVVQLSMRTNIEESVGIDPLFLVPLLVIAYAATYECLRPSLFDKVDSTVTRFQPRFAEKGIRASVVYYSVNKGRMTARSTYLVFSALATAHDRTLISDADYSHYLTQLA